MTYEEQAHIQLQFWQHKMQKKPSLVDRVSKGLQDKINNIIPEKVHAAITITIEKMVKGVLFGAQYTTSSARSEFDFQMREMKVKNRIEFYQKAASVEGAVTGAGGFLMGLADFPILIALKLKLLFEIASIYGYDVDDYRERLYILYIFQLAFSSQQKRNEIYKLISNWQAYSETLPANVEQFDWRTFQQEYRDYIDLAKMAQLLPVIGAAVGAVVNYKLISQLGETAMNCYRMRMELKKLEN